MNLDLRTPTINWGAPEWQYPANRSDHRYYNPDGTPKPFANTPMQDKFDAYHREWDAKRAAAPSPQQAYIRQVQAQRQAAAPKPEAPVAAAPAAPKPATPVQPVSQVAAQPAQQPKPPAAQPPMPNPPVASLGGGNAEGPQQPKVSRATPNIYQYNPDAQQAANAFQNLHSSHFGHQANAIGAVNGAMQKAANQWSEAAARNQSYQHNAWMANQAAQMKMAELQSNERMAAAELNERKEKRKALMGLMGGFSPLGRSLLG